MTPPGAAHSRLTVNASDSPGLLAQIALFLSTHDMNVESARIATLGDRIEDVFHITGADGGPLDAARAYEFANALRQHLDRGLPP